MGFFEDTFHSILFGIQLIAGVMLAITIYVWVMMFRDK